MGRCLSLYVSVCVCALVCACRSRQLEISALALAVCPQTQLPRRRPLLSLTPPLNSLVRHVYIAVDSIFSPCLRRAYTLCMMCTFLMLRHVLFPFPSPPFICLPLYSSLYQSFCLAFAAVGPINGEKLNANAAAATAAAAENAATVASQIRDINLDNLAPRALNWRIYLIKCECECVRLSVCV